MSIHNNNTYNFDQAIINPPIDQTPHLILSYLKCFPVFINRMMIKYTPSLQLFADNGSFNVYKCTHYLNKDLFGAYKFLMSLLCES